MRTIRMRLRMCFAGLLGLAVAAGLAGALQGATASGPPQGTEKSAAESPDKTDSTTQPGTPAGSNSRKAAVSKPGRDAEDPKPRREPSPSEIIKMLQEEREPRKTVLTLPSRPGEERRTTVIDAPNAIQPLVHKLLPDGSRIVDRPGRLARHDDYFVFSFESRGEGAPEPPIRLLPNRLLEDMEIYSEGGEKPVVFVVSGEVTEYRGLNYLLIQKLLLQPDLDNLK